jgi:hypothetical protein
MADDAKAKTDAKPKAKISFQKWATQPATDRSAALELEKRQQLWTAMNDFVGANGGWITSPAGVMRMRIEAPTGSPLPNKLAELGYAVRACGCGQRVSPLGKIEPHGRAPVKYHPAIITTDIVEIELGNGRDAPR